jgi:hypothetical protein
MVIDFRKKKQKNKNKTKENSEKFKAWFIFSPQNLDPALLQSKMD